MARMIARGIVAAGTLAAAQSAEQPVFPRPDGQPPSEGIGPSWTLVGEDGNDKWLTPLPLVDLLTPNETAVIDDYDRLFEKYSMYCNGRWLGAQVLQDAQDLMYLQHLVFSVRPAVIVETGTYKGGLTYYLASLMSSLGINGKILSIDRNPPELVFGASWFCPVCEECTRVWETEPWERHVEFYQGWADSQEVLAVTRLRLAELQGEGRGSPVLVNLDACHEYDCVYKEIVNYAPMVTVGSYLVVQDAKLDKLWGKPAVSAAIARFLRGTSDFVRDRTVPFYGYSQHMYLRRVAKTLPDVPVTEVLEGIPEAEL